ncbi:hypothetical protein Tco_0147511, partial [Tanacetum coccineum]
KLHGILCVERQRIDNLCRHMSYTQEELRQIHRSRYYDRREFRRLKSYANMTVTHFGMTPKAIEELIAQQVAEALAAQEANHVVRIVIKSQRQNRDDGNNKNGGGKGNENRGGDGNGNPNVNDRDSMHVAHECTY